MLNPSQAEAVRTLSGPMLVLAGAGSGKTRVVTYRIAQLIKSGVAPGRILAVTFTNKAAAEMQERAAALLGKKLEERPEISTFHSLCVRILRRNIRRLGYPEKFAIYDRGDQEGAARDALRQIRAPSESLRPGDLLAIISRWKSASLGPPQAMSAAETDKEHLAAAAYRRYQQNLKAAGAVDFDDLLLLTEQLYRQFPAVRREDAARYDHLLVDEYQDTNGSQYRIVRDLAAGHRNLCVVGDDDQSIYGWRGAEVTHILRFNQDWPDAKVVRLEENYRSTGEILAVANRLIAFNSKRHPKILRAIREAGEPPKVWQFKDEEEEAKGVVADIRHELETSDLPPREVAILFRTNEQPRALEMELRKAKLPYVLIGGMSFYDRKEVRDVLAYLKLLAHRRDEVSLLRIINKPPRGIGQTKVARLTASAVESGKPLWDVLPHDGDGPIGGFCRMIEDFAAKCETRKLVDVATALLDRIGYRDEIARTYPEANDQEARWQSVEELISALGRYESKAAQPTLAGFLTDVALAERDETEDKDSQLNRNAIALMTMHSAKGLEFSRVYIVGMEESILPHHRSIATGDTAIDEERRLCYVGLTRARDRLTLSLSLTRLKWGKVRDTIPSRFLYELTGQAQKAPTAPPPKGKRRPPRATKKSRRHL